MSSSPKENTERKKYLSNQVMGLEVQVIVALNRQAFVIFKIFGNCDQAEKVYYLPEEEGQPD